MKFDEPVIFGMAACQKRGVQQQRFTPLTGTIKPVADNSRVKAERVGTVHAKLMGAAGERGVLNARKTAMLPNPAPHGDCFPAVFRVIYLVGTVDGIEPERQGYPTRLVCSSLVCLS